MQKAKSIQFTVTRWQHNEKAVFKNLRTTADLMTYALRNTEDGGATVAGFAFRWFLTIYADDLEVVYFTCEELLVVDDKNISEEEVQQIVRQSYIMAYGEAATRNMSIGLTTSFPKLEQMNINFREIRNILDK